MAPWANIRAMAPVLALLFLVSASVSRAFVLDADAAAEQQAGSQSGGRLMRAQSASGVKVELSSDGAAAAASGDAASSEAEEEAFYEADALAEDEEVAGMDEFAWDQAFEDQEYMGEHELYEDGEEDSMSEDEGYPWDHEAAMLEGDDADYADSEHEADMQETGEQAQDDNEEEEEQQQEEVEHADDDDEAAMLEQGEHAGSEQQEEEEQYTFDDEDGAILHHGDYEGEHLEGDDHWMQDMEAASFLEEAEHNWDYPEEEEAGMLEEAYGMEDPEQAFNEQAP